MSYMIADTACVDPAATIGDLVEIGPYCIVGPGARIGRETRLSAHVHIEGDVRIGEGNYLGPFVSVGDDNGGGSLVLGDGNELREGVVLRAGSGKRAETVLGRSNRLGPHVVAEAGVRIGDGNSLAACVTLGPGTVIGSRSTLTPGVSTHARVTIGSHVLVGGPCRVFHDLPPFLVCDGHPARVRGLNMVGLRRLGLAAPALRGLQEAYRLLYRARLSPDAARIDLERHGLWTDETAALVDAVRSQREGRHGRALDRDMAGEPNESAEPDEGGEMPT